MANARKLGLEIERTLKKVQEGLDQFDEIWNKVYEGDLCHVKDKLEADLKKEIKKLQRLRDQIKTWVAGNEVKDKADLMEARRKIERQMEKFKEYEKEMKTKAFSKEGLGRMTKVDPREKEKSDRVDWINSKVEKLQELVEGNEAEQEALLAVVAKKKEPPVRVKELAEINARHKKHVERLEQILRALDNDTIQFEKVDDIRDNFDYYLENPESDEDGIDDVDNIYADLLDVLDNIEVHVPILVEKPAKAAAAPVVPEPKKAKADKEADREKERQRLERERERAAVAARTQLAGQSKGGPSEAAASEAGVPKPLAIPSTSGIADLQSPTRGMPQQAKAVTRDPPILSPTGGAAAGLPRGMPAQQPAAAQGGAPVRISMDSDTSSSLANSGLPPPGAPMGIPGGFAPVQTNPSNQPSAWGSRDDAAPAAAPTAPSGVQAATNALSDSLPAGFAPFNSGGPFAGTMGQQMDAGAPSAAAAPPTPPAAAAAPPLGGSPLSFLDLLQACINSGHAIPQPHDGIWGTRHCARKGSRPFGLPASYPSQPPSVLSLPAMWENMKEVEDLFAAFYLTPGTNCQFYAARELKRRNWRFHKQLGAWFQRHQDPRESNEEYENGDYIYFDYKLSESGEGAPQGWVYRMKQSFMFRYDQLENELGI